MLPQISTRNKKGSHMAAGYKRNDKTASQKQMFWRSSFFVCIYTILMPFPFFKFRLFTCSANICTVRRDRKCQTC